ncbi:MAG: hypothetical protein ABJH05_09570 [Fulvivirga sp.]
MIKQLLIIVIILSAGLAKAQNDKIYLQNGSLVKGLIIGSQSNKLMLVIADDTVALSYTSIQAMNISRATKRNPLIKNELVSMAQHNRDLWSINLGIGGMVDDDYDGFKMRTTFSSEGIYRFGQFLQLGLGTDIMWYESFAAMPVYLTYRGSLSPFNRGVFYYMGYGRSLGWERDDCNCNNLKTSRFMKAGLGFQFSTGSIPLSVSVGWVQQKVALNYDNPWERRFAPDNYNYKLKQRLNSLEMKIGMTF